MPVWSDGMVMVMEWYLRSRDKDGGHTTESAIIENPFLYSHIPTATCNRTGFIELIADQGHSRSPIVAPMESSYTTSYWWIILSCIVCCTVFGISQVMVKFSLSTGWIHLLNAFVCGWSQPLNVRRWYLAWKILRDQSILRYKVYFDILNSFGVDHECDTDGTATSIACVSRRALKTFQPYSITDETRHYTGWLVGI